MIKLKKLDKLINLVYEFGELVTLISVIIINHNVAMEFLTTSITYIYILL